MTAPATTTTPTGTTARTATTRTATPEAAPEAAPKALYVYGIAPAGSAPRPRRGSTVPRCGC
ncbi:hypothetical protein R2F25_03130 [Streptomyces sp. UP1A-1]|nr:hypothetical protein [Streptomyces sp. UP1A-1]